MEFVENLAQLSDKLLKYQREEKRIFEVELQRQKDGVRMVSAASYDIFDVDALWYRYKSDQSYVQRRIKSLKYYYYRLWTQVT